MNTKKKYVFPVFAAVFALMFAAATPYVIAEPGQDKGDYAYDHANMKQDMTEKLNSYCQMSASEQAVLIEEHYKTEEMVAMMNEYCLLDDSGREAFIAEHKDQYKSHHDDMNDKFAKQHMVIEVDGFTGKIQAPEISSMDDMKAAHEDIKTQINVKLSDAAITAEDAGLEVMKGNIGMVVNENGYKSVAWILTAMNMDIETMSATMFIVDAADITNTAQVTKEFDHTMMMMMEDKDKRNYDKQEHHYEKKLSDPEQIENKIAKIEKKLSKAETGNIATDELKSQFLDLLKQLQTAITNGDDTQADSLREQLNDLRNQMGDMKRHY